MDLLKAKANFSRVCQLLVDKGGEALRFKFDAIHPPSTLSAVLNTKKSAFQKIKNGVINDQQWDLLFPTSGAAPDSNNFDITLLTILLRNICGLPLPAKGWNAMPSAADTSISDDIVRIKMFRNYVYGHIASTQMDDKRFEKLWQEISQPLTRLRIPQKDIDEIKVAPLSPEEESYIQQLKEWKERDDDILSKLKDVKKEMSELREIFVNVISQKQNPEQWEPRSCLPDKLLMFTGREKEIQNVIAYLNDREMAVVSLRGGPGFGKTAIAIQVSHKLNEDPSILVLFSQLATATTVDEMVIILCRDVGINYEDDPLSSLILRLRNIKSKVVFVMDDIDNLLEDKDGFYEFLRLLRNNSSQHCQIVTTSRTSFEIPDLSNCEVEVDVMNDEACTELLKRRCPEKDDKFLQILAQLCGNIPLAMCIAGSRVKSFEDPDALLQHLEEQPMKILENRKSGQYVNRAFNMSFKRCSDEEQETLVRLSVFAGNFSKKAVKVVIEKDDLKTIDILENLVSLSLIKEVNEHRYSIHLLIKHFLRDKQKCDDGQTKNKAKRARAEAMRAEVLMVEYYLELGHKRTKESYSKDGYKENREALQQEASNIQNVLKICCQQERPTSSDISECLAHSKIYTISVKCFSIFVRTMIPELIVDNFLQRCANLAEERKEHAIKINVDCLLADRERERSESVGKSDEHYISKMEETKKDFETHYEVLKQDKSLCAHYYYQYLRYLFRKADSRKEEERLKLQIEVKELLEKLFEIKKTLTDTLGGKADIIYSLLHLGHTYKSISLTKYYLKDDSSKTSLEQAENCYKEAIQLSQKELGEHELTSSCHKDLGDLFSKIDKYVLAEKEYTIAKQIRKKVGLVASERHVLLLNNLGMCFSKTDRANAAIKVLEKARDTAEKLAESDEPNRCKAKVYASLAIAYDLEQKCSEAVYYAKKAMKFRQLQKVVPNSVLKNVLNILENNAH